MTERNPPWARDELILALDLYVQYEGNPPGKKSPEIIKLSETLNAMGRSVTGRNSDFRNPNGVVSGCPPVHMCPPAQLCARAYHWARQRIGCSFGNDYFASAGPGIGNGRGNIASLTVTA